MRFAGIVTAVTFVVLLFSRAASAQCDNCPSPEVVLYGVQMNVPQPPPDDSLGQYTKPSSQQALLDWIALGDAQVPMAGIFNNDPEKDCVHWVDGTMGQELAANPDTNVIVHLQNWSTGDVPPAGPVDGVDYLVWSSIDSSGGQYHFHVYLEDAYSRNRIATGEADFTDPNNSQQAAQTAVSQIEPIFDKIRAYQKVERDLNGENMAIHARITVVPAKGQVKGGESIAVQFLLNDCDDSPLRNRWLKIKASQGHFDADSVQTDANGSATANFIADNVTAVANLNATYYPYYTPSHKTNGAWGDTTVNINLAPTRNWVLYTIMNQRETDTYSSATNGYNSYGKSENLSDASVTQFAVGDFSDSSISIDGVVGGKGESRGYSFAHDVQINSPTGSFFENTTISQTSETDPGENFSQDPRLRDLIQYGSYNGISASSAIMVDQTQHTYIYEAGSSVLPDPSTLSLTLTPTGVPDQYDLFMVGSDGLGDGQNATWTKTDSGFIFKGDIVQDTTITSSPSGGTYLEENHKEEHITIYIRPYGNTTGIRPPVSNSIPDKYQLSQNYPNPFNPTTWIRYQVPSASLVTLMVYDVLGREVRTLVNERQSPGYYSVTFNASRLSSGIYFYRIQAGSFEKIGKMVLVK